MKSKLLSFVLVLTFVLAACSPAATPTGAPPTSQPADPPTAVVTEPSAPFPTGRFEGKGQAAYYSADGTFEFYSGASKTEPLFVGKYTVEGDLITSVNPNETDPNCKDAVAYKWFYKDDKLTFWPTKDDTCRGRREANADTYTYNPRYIPEINIIARDYDYVAPKSIRSGWVRVTLTNKGTEPHHVQFLRLNDGVTFEQFQAALAQGEGPALAMTKQMGGVGAIAPGLSAQADLVLTPGEYVILCLIPSPSDHVAHEAKGMIKSLTVRNEDGHGSEPSSDMTVQLKDFSFNMLDILPAGPFSIQVMNSGPEAHEFNILKLADGKTPADVMAFLSGEAAGPPPFTPVGGANGIDVGVTEYAEVNLEPGNYVAICNIPSPKAEGHPHFTLGMIKAFTVK